MRPQKEGEYEHNLRILAALLRGELEQEAPDAANFARMGRRVEGMSLTDLKVIAMIDEILSRYEGEQRNRAFVSASRLEKSDQNKHNLSKKQIQEALVDLVGRGFLIADGATRTDKSEEYYFGSTALSELMDRAREQVAREE